MRKHGKESILRQKHVKQLLDQLTKRDIESTQLRITQLHNQQRHLNMRTHLPASVTERYSNSKGRRLSKNKENVLATSQGNIQKNLIKNNKTLSSSSRSRWGLSTERSQSSQRNSQNSLKKIENSTFTLPAISTKLLKKSSFERQRQISDTKNTDSEMGDLTVIQEEAATPNKHLAFGMTFGKLQKQLSWSPSSFI